MAYVFADVYDNTKVPGKFVRLLGIESFPKVFSNEDEQMEQNAEK
jgi:hypothetical protein